MTKFKHRNSTHFRNAGLNEGGETRFSGLSGERSRKRSLMSQTRERGNVGRRDYATFPSLSSLSQPFFRIHSYRVE